jgi:hypothetical protein
MEMKTVSKIRAESLKQYMSDCRSGVDTVIAWKAHWARMTAVDPLRYPIRAALSKATAQ